MTDPRHRVLIPVAVLEGETISEALIESLAGIPVVILGYHVVPEQPAPEQARHQFESKAQAKLDGLEAAFADHGGSVTTQLVFTQSDRKTFERIAVEHSCDALLLLNPLQSLDKVLITVRGDVNVDNIADLVSDVFGPIDATLTLFHVVPGAEVPDHDDPDQLLTSVEDALTDAGIDPARIEREIVDAPSRGQSPLEIIIGAADDHDLVVLGESAPSIRDRILGEPAWNVATQTIDPVLVVRRSVLEDDEDGAAGTGEGEDDNAADEHSEDPTLE